MTGTATTIANALRTLAPDKKLATADVPLIDKLAAQWDARSSVSRRVSQRGVDLIHSFETLKLTSYKDPGSKNGLPITCGWGTTVDENGGPIPLGAVWTKEKADRLFARDLAKVEAAVSKLIGSTPTTQGQYDALCSLAYNIGAGDGGLKTSTLLRMHNNGDYAGAKGQFGRWVYNDGKKLNGLVRRRASEAELYAS